MNEVIPVCMQPATARGDSAMFSLSQREKLIRRWQGCSFTMYDLTLGLLSIWDGWDLHSSNLFIDWDFLAALTWRHGRIGQFKSTFTEDPDFRLRFLKPFNLTLTNFMFCMCHHATSLLRSSSTSLKRTHVATALISHVRSLHSVSRRSPFPTSPIIENLPPSYHDQPTSRNVNLCCRVISNDSLNSVRQLPQFRKYRVGRQIHTVANLNGRTKAKEGLLTEFQSTYNTVYALGPNGGPISGTSADGRASPESQSWKGLLNKSNLKKDVVNPRRRIAGKCLRLPSTSGQHIRRPWNSINPIEESVPTPRPPEDKAKQSGRVLSSIHTLVETSGDTKPKREIWQLQKSALSEKFGSLGWAPRKRLSPDSLEGIRALHAQYPNTFTTPVLSGHFKVSPEAIRRILKSKWRPNNDEEDKRRERWNKRGLNIWEQMNELGIKPPRKWRDQGFGKSGKPAVVRAERLRSSTNFTHEASPEDGRYPEIDLARSIRSGETGHPASLAERIL